MVPRPGTGTARSVENLKGKDSWDLTELEIFQKEQKRTRGEGDVGRSAAGAHDYLDFAVEVNGAGANGVGANGAEVDGMDVDEFDGGIDDADLMEAIGVEGR